MFSKSELVAVRTARDLVELLERWQAAVDALIFEIEPHVDATAESSLTVGPGFVRLRSLDRQLSFTIVAVEKRAPR